MAAPTSEVQRKRVLQRTRYQCCFQALLTTSLLVCGGLLAQYSVGKILSSIFYSVIFTLGAFVLLSCLLTFRIANNGPSFDSTPEARTDVLCGIRWKQTLLVFLIFVSMATIVIIMLAGFCLDMTDECTYSDDDSKNKSISIVTFILTILTFMSAAYDVFLIRMLKPAFGTDHVTATENPEVSRGIPGHFGPQGANTTHPVLHIPQQNQQLQQPQSQFYPFTTPGSNFNHCYTNMAFTLPDLPPYSPTPVGGSSTVPTNSAPALQTQSSSIIFPSEPPPPYTEVADFKLT